jgi:hypothetical protein
VLRPARYIDETETVEFGEVHVFAGPQFVITVRHSEAPDLAHVREQLEARPDLLQRGSLAIVHAILDQVVDDYEPVVAGVEAGSSGSSTTNEVAWSGSDSTQTLPPLASTKPRTIARPRPEPRWPVAAVPER